MFTRILRFTIKFITYLNQVDYDYLSNYVVTPPLFYYLALASDKWVYPGGKSYEKIYIDNDEC